MANIQVKDRIDFDASFRQYKLTYTIELDEGETLTSTMVKSSSIWCNVKNTTITAYKTELELASNGSVVDGREATVTITATTSTGTYSKTIVISQSKMEIFPIWKNRAVRIDTQSNYVNYYVQHNNNIIYSGKAYLLPDTDYIEIDITKICSSYLDSTLENSIDSPQNYNAQNGVGYFTLWVNKEMHSGYLFYNSYAYKDCGLYDDRLGDYHIKLSEPIRKIFDKRQYAVFSFFNVSQDGNSYSNDFYFHKGELTHLEVRETLTGRKQYTTLMEIPEGYDSAQFFDEYYIITDTCAKYCLYYQNAYGGFDSLLINANDKQTDKITSYKYIKAVDNTTSKFGTKKYMNVILPTYKLYTDWLTDDESSRMYHLLESTEVYLHNLEDGSIVPVNITNTKCEYKTYVNNGKKKFYYEIDVESAQNRIRQ